MHKKGHRNLVVCTWNVQTLVENSGDVRIRRKRQVATGDEGSSVREVDKKLDLLLGEVKRYGISVAGIQETKWFRNDVWPVQKGSCSYTQVGLSRLMVKMQHVMKVWGLCEIPKLQ